MSRRPLLILLALVLAGIAIVGLSSLAAKRLCARHLAHPGDDLAWLRCEFGLSDAEMQRIRPLHEAYLPQCRAMCARIAAKQAEAQAALAAGQGITPEAEQHLADLAGLRAQCQVQMLRHFYAVGQAMPAAQGQRYFAEMQRFTLGYHGQVEQSMAAPVSSAHGSH